MSAVADDEQLRSWAADAEVRYTRILLDRGVTADQPMLSWLATGTAAEAEFAARETAADLERLGFPVIRLKLEAAAASRVEPATDGLYFEHHVKLLLPEKADLGAVRTIAVRHDARLSRNARRVRADGVRERFVTQRCYQGDRVAAAAALAGLITDLTAEGYAIAEVEEEFVLVDDNPALDAGWFSPAAARSGIVGSVVHGSSPASSGPSDPGNRS